MIYPYKMSSVSSKALADKLKVKRIKREGSSFKGGEHKLVINWGCTKVPPEVEKCMLLNKTSAVALVSDKLKFFNSMKDKVNIPEFTTSQEEAQKWLEDGSAVLGRATLNGHSGQGIHIINSIDEWDKFSHDKFKMYVKYIPKKEEYRVHVVGDQVIDVRRKALKGGVLTPNWKIRNLAGGFIFAKDGFKAPEQVLEQSIKAVDLAGLDFGAVDVIWNEFRKEAYVLEINSAPGLEGSTIDNYAKGFEVFYQKQQKSKDDIYEELNKIFTPEVVPAPW